MRNEPAHTDAAIPDTIHDYFALYDRGVEQFGWSPNPLHEYLKEQGVPFKHSAYDQERYGPYGRPRGCYANATHLALDHNNLTYYEGLADHQFMPITHAWCCDEYGLVVDSTWRHNCDECGFCDGTGTQTLDCDGDPLDTPQTCGFCEGSGKTTPIDRTDAVYLGVPFSRDELLDHLLTQKVYGGLLEHRLQTEESAGIWKP